MSDATTTTWIGWHRPDGRSPWSAIVQGDDERAVFRQLLDAVHGGDKCVLAGGVDPNVKPATMRRRRF
ncbi:MAG: hypothetical protein ACYC3I_06335 [Gemmataceae bacterium]